MFQTIKKLAAIAAFTLGLSTLGHAVVLINEIDADTPGTDAAEFVELYNTGGAPVNLGTGGYVLVFYNGAVANNPSYLAVNLTGTIGAGGYYVVGNTGVIGVNETFAGNTLQQGADAVALYSGTTATSFFPPAVNAPGASGTLVDAIVYGTADPTDADLLTAFSSIVGGQMDESGAGPSDTNSIQRTTDGAGGPFVWTSTTIDAPTPNVANGGAADNPNLIVNSSLNFGTVAPASITTASLVVQNSPAATINLNISSTPISGANAVNFSIVGSPVLPLLANGVAGSTGTYVLQFDPQGTTGSFTANLVINSTDSGDPVTTVTLSGTSSAPVAGTAMLIISQVIDGTLGTAGVGSGSLPKSFEITNVGDGSADLTLYSAKLGSNGNPFSTTVSLNAGGGGFLAPGASMIIASTGSAAAIAAIPGVVSVHTFESGVANFNGDDAVGLFQGATVIDVFGQEGIDGTGLFWEYLDSYAYRAPNIGSGNTTFSAGEWVFASVSSLVGLNAAQHGALVGSGVAGISPQLGFYPGVVEFNPADISTLVNHWSLFE